jgi:hypothetical protein
MDERSYGAKFGLWKVLGAYLENCRGSGAKDLQFGESGGFMCNIGGLGLI